jgi:hypothetical protein
MNSFNVQPVILRGGSGTRLWPSQRRLFFERQLDQTRKSLTNAEAAARQGLEKGGLVVIDAQGRGMVETTARLRGQIAVKEIQISAMRAFATGQNPDLKQAQHELDAMKQELAKMEGTSSGRENAGGVGKADGTENLRLLRAVSTRGRPRGLASRRMPVICSIFARNRTFPTGCP